MRIAFLILGLFVGAAPAAALANCPPKGCPPAKAPPARAPARPVGPSPAQGRPASAFMQRPVAAPRAAPPPAFALRPHAAALRPSPAFAPREPSAVRADAPGAPGEPRRFGTAAQPVRRFGEPVRAFGQGEPAPGMAPHRSEAGRVYLYHGREFHPFHVARYGWPPGFRYRRYAVGYALPPAFIAPQYYVTDYALYEIDAPPAGLQWVRYGPDLLLINPETGRVRNAIYGVFEEGDAPPDPSLVAETPVPGGAGQ